MLERVVAMDRNIIKGALYYTKEDSAASCDMAHGVVVGIMTALVADRRRKFGTALRIVAECLPEGYRKDCVPLAWRKDLERELYRAYPERIMQ